MGLFTRLFGNKVESMQANALEVNAPASDARHMSRMVTIWTYLAQKGEGISQERRDSFEAELTRRAHALAAKGHPFITTLNQLKEILDGSSSS